MWRGLERSRVFLLTTVALKAYSRFIFLCIVYCPCGREKTPDQSSLRRKGVYCGSQFEGAAYHGGEGMAAGKREVESQMLMLSHFPVFIQSPSHRILSHTFRVSLLSAVHLV